MFLVHYVHRGRLPISSLSDQSLGTLATGDACPDRPNTFAFSSADFGIRNQYQYSGNPNIIVITKIKSGQQGQQRKENANKKKETEIKMDLLKMVGFANEVAEW